MATVAETMSWAARRCSVTPPTGWVAATTSTAMEFKDALAETVEEIIERVDLPSPVTKNTTITGTGTSTYSLPSDFSRLTRDPLSVYETTSTRRACVPLPTNGSWSHLLEMGSAGTNRYYRTSGNDEDGYEIEFYSTPSTAVEIIVSYVSKNWLTLSSTDASTWTSDDQTLLLPQNLVRTGVVWRFNQRKGFAYADLLADYEIRMSRAINDRRGLRSINMGEKKLYSPWDIPVPDYIPT